MGAFRGSIKRGSVLYSVPEWVKVQRAIRIRPFSGCATLYVCDCIPSSELGKGTPASIAICTRLRALLVRHYTCRRRAALKS